MLKGLLKDIVIRYPTWQNLTILNNTICKSSIIIEHVKKNCSASTVNGCYKINICYCFCLVLSCVLLFCDPMDCSPRGSSVPGISQAIILKWVSISFSRGSSQPRNETCISYLPGGFFITEPPGTETKMFFFTYFILPEISKTNFSYQLSLQNSCAVQDMEAKNDKHLQNI